MGRAARWGIVAALMLGVGIARADVSGIPGWQKE